MGIKSIIRAACICLLIAPLLVNATITDLAIDYSGVFGTKLFYSLDNNVFRLNADGKSELFYSHTQRINSIAFSNNIAFGSNLYLSTGSTSTAEIIKVDQNGIGSAILSGAPNLMTDIAFTTSTDFENNLYASTVVNFPGGTVDSITSTGVLSTFSTFSPTILSGLAFGSSAFGNSLYVADEAGANNGEIYLVNSSGSNSVFTHIPGQPVNLAMSPGGLFGDYLYVSTFQNGSIYQVDSNGNIALFSSGFVFGLGFTGDMAFDASGNSLYVADNNKIYLLTDGNPDKQLLGPVPIPAAVWLFCTGLVGLVSVATRKANRDIITIH